MSAYPEYDEMSVPLASVRGPVVVTASKLSKRYGQGDAQVRRTGEILDASLRWSRRFLHFFNCHRTGDQFSRALSSP